MPNKRPPKLLAIVGPTASGKSDMAIFLAKKINGEIISADSRQVYKGLDIGTGKITEKEMQSIPHHLLDVADPRRTFNVEEFKKKAEKTIGQILKKNKIPIICGGTGFYIQTLIDNISIPKVPPNTKLRKKLETYTSEKLFKMFVEKDPDRASSIDPKNRRRLIRALEIVASLGKVPVLMAQPHRYDVLYIGLLPKNLRACIHKRLRKRIKTGMISEGVHLHKKGLSYKRMEELGLEYRYLAWHLKGELSKKEMLVKLEAEIWHYTKRQMTWFKKNKQIHWFSPKDKKEITTLAKKFLY